MPIVNKSGKKPKPLVPVGMIMPFAGSVVPEGWLLCDGSAVSRTQYARLFQVIGTTYGAGDGSTTFNLPNLKGRVPVGLNTADTDFNTLGKTGGEKSVTLTVSQMPSHNHYTVINTTIDGNHSHSYANANWYEVPYLSGSQSYTFYSSAGSYYSTSTSLNHSHTISGTTTSTGGGQAHNNLQPYLVVNYIIKAVED